MIVKCKFDDTMIDLMNDMLDEFSKIKAKETQVIIDVNPNDMAH